MTTLQAEQPSALLALQLATASALIDDANARRDAAEDKADAYAQQAADLRRALAEAHTREIFLNDTIAQLREQLATLGAA